MHSNPYAYDEEKYTEVSIALAADPVVSRYIEELWKAGATYGDIENEFMSVISETINELETP